MRVTCKSCGRTYDYHKEGTCPDCGAFNRLPRREKVNADGTVRHMTSEDFMEKGHGSHAGKVCFEEKVCYEEKECHESVARQVRRQVQEFRNARPAVMKNVRSKRQSTAAPKVLILIIIIIFFAIIGSVFSMIRSWNIDFEEHYGTSWKDIFTRDTEPPEDAALRFFKIGDEFKWNGYLIEVRSWSLEGDVGIAEIKCTGHLEGTKDIAFGKQVESAQMPHLEFTYPDGDLVVVECSGCSVEDNLRTIRLTYEIVDFDAEKQELILYSHGSSEPWQVIYVDLTKERVR